MTRIGGTLPLPAPPASEVPKAAGGASFGSVLGDALEQVNALQHEADAAIESLATGGNATLHDTMLAVRNFQRKVGMQPADGYAGVKLLARLRQGL